MGIGKAILNDSYKPYTSAFDGVIRPHVGGALVGAGFGTVAGSVLPYGDAATGAAVGGVAGALAMPAIGMVGAGIGWAATNTDKLGRAAKSVGGYAKDLGGDYYKMARPLLKAGGYGTLATGYAGAKMAQSGGKKYMNMFSKIVKYQDEKVVTGKDGKPAIKSGGLRISKRAGALGVGIAAIAGLNNAANNHYDSRAGRPAGSQNATPNYLDNAGASGDLVFAMHQNRRG